MCFSATASFVTAGVTGLLGIVALTRATRPRELPLAATPILFAAQQSIEGLLWLVLPAAPYGNTSSTLTVLFLLFAQALWPVYAPLAVLLVEPSEQRRRLMLLPFAAGVAVAGYLLWEIAARPHGARILDCHIVYVTEYRHSAAIAVGYLAATTLPLMLSSRRTIVALGVIVLVGCAVSYAFYWAAFVSVWCFFAAAASASIVGYFEQARRQRLTTVDV